MSVSNSRFTIFKNIFYTIYIVISAFFLMNDYKITTLLLMAVLAPLIVGMEHRDATKQHY
jgi:hypothetical protein